MVSTSWEYMSVNRQYKRTPRTTWHTKYTTDIMLCQLSTGIACTIFNMSSIDRKMHIHYLSTLTLLTPSNGCDSKNHLIDAQTREIDSSPVRDVSKALQVLCQTIMGKHGQLRRTILVYRMSLSTSPFSIRSSEKGIQLTGPEPIGSNVDCTSNHTSTSEFFFFSNP
jgi:hypothetical protein